MPVTRTSQQPTVYQFALGDWRGGYFRPPVDVVGKTVVLHLRSLASRPISVRIELKNEGTSLAVATANMSVGAEWQRFEIAVPDTRGLPALNYLALADPFGTFELGSVQVSDQRRSP